MAVRVIRNSRVERTCRKDRRVGPKMPLENLDLFDWLRGNELLDVRQLVKSPEGPKV
jgi:hypothetical protein